MSRNLLTITGPFFAEVWLDDKELERLCRWVERNTSASVRHTAGCDCRSCATRAAVRKWQAAQG